MQIRSPAFFFHIKHGQRVRAFSIFAIHSIATAKSHAVNASVREIDGVTSPIRDTRVPTEGESVTC